MSSLSDSTHPPLALNRNYCTLCVTKQLIKYTCPRCHTQTCSLACSKLHKQSTGCSGLRDKAAFVPLNRYGWGSMMDDYSFLEDVSRKVGDWGREIVKGGFDMSVSGRGMSGRGRGRGDRGRRGSVRGRDRGGRGRNGKGKRDILKMRLEERDIEVELLPSGMERRQLNQSYWDMKTQAVFLTIQFKFHPPSEVSSAQESGSLQPFTLLTHRNSLLTPLLSLVQKHIRDYVHRKSVTKSNKAGDASSFPVWLPSMILPPPEDPENLTIPTFTIAAPSDPLLLARSAALLSGSVPYRNSTSVKPKTYYNLDPNESLTQSLRGTQFVEFPMVEVWQQFSGVLVDKATGTVRCMHGDVEPRTKRRKIDPKEGRKAMNGLVGDYGTDNEEDDGADQKRMEGLVGYVGSESDGMEEVNAVDDGIEVEDSDEDEEVEVDPAALLELIKRAKQDGSWAEEEDNDSCGDNSGDDDT